MKKVLVIFAHPRYEQSRTNKTLLQSIKEKNNVTVHDLYEEYPDFHIDVPREKELLLQHEVIIWQHPFYWYSCPPIMKQWIDTVLEYGWAYGKNKNALKDKICLQVITVGGSRDVYCPQGNNFYTINEFLRPFEQTARLCKMEYLPPYAIMGTHKLNEDSLKEHIEHYTDIVKYLNEGKDLRSLRECKFENDLEAMQVPIDDNSESW